jgi:hypothetical protein
MTSPADERNTVSDLRDASRLAVDATRGLTDLVEAMHVAVSPIERRPAPGHTARSSGLTGFVYRGVRGATWLAGTGIDAALARLEPLAGRQSRSPRTEVILAALNGVIGDELAAKGSALAIAMQFRRGGHALGASKAALRDALGDAASPRIVLFAHGLCMNDLQWRRGEHDQPAILAEALGATAIHLHYNTGLHVASNGAMLADKLEALLSQWPVPVTALTIVGHSMGGLVARSAHHAAGLRGHRWPQLLRALACLGTPHHGAPLERSGNALGRALGLTPYTAPFVRLARLRSAGITDLRYGSVLEIDRAGRDRFARRAPCAHLPLPADVACYAVAATTAAADTGRALPGDGLVPVDSALGRHADPLRTLAFAPSNRMIVHDTGHLALQTRPEVTARLVSWLS